MKKIYLTIDTECHDINKLNQYIYGKKNHSFYGLPKILDVCKRFNVPVNVFLDVCECIRYGDKYTQDIIDLIHKYQQPIFFHFHPNYLSGDDNRSFLWQYSESEQRSLLSEGLKIYERFSETSDRLVFRAGRYGVDEVTYNLLSELGIGVLDLSYFCHGSKMCHLYTDTVNVCNKPFKYKGVTILPNTTYVGYHYFGKSHAFILNVAQTTYDEFKRFLSKTQLKDIVYTMHSWDFIKKWFFNDRMVLGNHFVIRRFEKTIQYARNNGYDFYSLDSFCFQDNRTDELVDLCSNVSGKFLGIFNNIVRFWGIARLNKKYFFLFFLLFMLILSTVLTIVL